MPLGALIGLIPAHAGKTTGSPPESKTPAAHPRSRGENDEYRNYDPLRAGSSPLTRGKPYVPEDALIIHGLIPAHAGKTGGEARLDTDRGGSSPLTRGKRDAGRRVGVRRGLIPAHAGKTKFYEKPPLDWEAHPRSRGENRSAWYFRRRTRGSSPLTRGKLEREPGPPEGRGLIPAHAGKTSMDAFRTPANQAHPRSRGENTS